MKTEKSTRSFTMTLRKLQSFKEWIGSFKIRPSFFRLISKSQNLILSEIYEKTSEKNKGLFESPKVSKVNIIAT